MNSIGGYFELELSIKKDYHYDAIKLNSARSCLEYLINSTKCSKIYLPHFTCDAIINSVKRTKINCEFYYIDERLEPIFDFSKIKNKELFLYTNYFGIKDSYVNKIIQITRNLIIDNSQSFFSYPNKGINSFYSPRKFLGVPDGGYLYTNAISDIEYNQDISYLKFKHLIKKIDIGTEKSYLNFLKNEKKIDNAPILKMSNLTNNLLKSINYQAIKEKRNNNFNYLQKHLNSQNEFNIDKNSTQIALTYPFLSKKKGLKEKLLASRIYTPTYWPNILKTKFSKTIEYNYTKNMIFLPIDQRLSKKELDLILNIIS
jgi:hypothetical protein